MRAEVRLAAFMATHSDGSADVASLPARRGVLNEAVKQRSSAANLGRYANKHSKWLLVALECCSHAC